VKAIADLGIEAPTVKDTGKIVKQIDNPSVGGKDVSAYLKALQSDSHTSTSKGQQINCCPLLIFKEDFRKLIKEITY